MMIFAAVDPTTEGGGRAPHQRPHPGTTSWVGKAGIGAAPALNAVLDINGGDTRGLRLRPRSTPGAPDTGTWHTGTIILDSAGDLFICTAPGSPGTWVKVGN